MGRQSFCSNVENDADPQNHAHSLAQQLLTPQRGSETTRTADYHLLTLCPS